MRQRLKNLAGERGRPVDEILRYYAIERFLYRLSVSQYAQKFYLKGGLMLRVWDAMEHRATMDIDLLAKTSNKLENVRNIITQIADIKCVDDAVSFDTSKLLLRKAQTGGEYDGVRCSFSAKLFTTKMPVLIDVGFNDEIIPQPKEIIYPTLLGMPQPVLKGYPVETVFAEKLESIVKLSNFNTRMKDFYDLWTIIKVHQIDMASLDIAIRKVFANRGTQFAYPIAFTKAFYENPENKLRWMNFLKMIGEEAISLEKVIADLSNFLERLISPFLSAAR